jgi:SAM-dependent methyltransferase
MPTAGERRHEPPKENLPELPADDIVIEGRGSDALRTAAATSGQARSTRALSFCTIAEDYDRFRPGPPAEILEWVLPPQCDVAVDIGAGTGALTRELVRHVGTVIAVEPDRRMGAVLASRVPRAAVLTGRAEDLPLPDGGVDAVVGSSMWHWVDEARAASEAARVLRPGGVLGVLWSGPDRSQPWLAELLARPGGSGTAGADGQHRHRHEMDLPADAPFSVPQARTLEWSMAVTPEHLVGLAGTYSGFIILPEAERIRLRRRLADAVANHPALAGRRKIELPMRCTCWRAVREP